MSRAAFLDRDGVINRKAPDGEYVTRLEDFMILSGVPKAITMLNKAGFRVIVVSNQRCVAKGLITITGLEMLHQGMCDELATAGAMIDGVYYCPHEELPRCNCRKPAPGMLLRAAEERHLDLKMSWMIGDSESDIQAGKNAGCKTARVVGQDRIADSIADVTALSLVEAIHRIFQREGIIAVPVDGDGEAVS